MNRNILFAIAMVCGISLLLPSLCLAQGQNTQELLKFVQKQNAQQCLQKVICELSVDPNFHGAQGIRFGRSLILLETQTDKESAQQYRDAARIGSQLGDVKLCPDHFADCNYQSEEIIEIGNQMIAG